MSCLKILLSINEARELLMAYSVKHHNSELIRFIIDLEKFKKDNSIERFMKLIELYILKDSMYELNIPQDLKYRMHIENNFDEFKEIELHVKILINQQILTEGFVDYITQHYKDNEQNKNKGFNLFQRRGSSTKI